MGREMVTTSQVEGFSGAFAPVLENLFGFRIGGIISHSFFRSYTTTFDFTSMRLVMTGESGKPSGSPLIAHWFFLSSSRIARKAAKPT